MRVSAVATILCVLCPSLVINLVSAWGKTGHEMVANLAWRLLTKETHSAILRILTNASYADCPDCSILGVISDWADQARYSWRYKWTAPLHYIDIRDDILPMGCPAQSVENRQANNQTCLFNYTRDCVDNVCVAGAIANFTQLVRDNKMYVALSNETIIATTNTTNVTELVQESLKFLVHFIGDIHQPLHVSRLTDRGGNDFHVSFESSFYSNRPLRLRSTSLAVASLHLRHRLERARPQRQLRQYSKNLHSVWDEDLLEKYIRVNCNASRPEAEHVLFAFIQQHARNDTTLWRKWLSCPNGGNLACPVAWAEESLDQALAWAYRNVNGSEIVNGTVLTEEYYETRLPVVIERLAAASVRLATTLALSLYVKSDERRAQEFLVFG